MESDSDPMEVTNPPSPLKNVYKDPDDGRQRFLLELEFIQCLANPTYIHYLAQNRYFEDEAFIGYLKYLQYWQRPEYLKFIMYPHCLFFLELLQNANFRNAMAYPANKLNNGDISPSPSSSMVSENVSLLRRLHQVHPFHLRSHEKTFLNILITRLTNAWQVYDLRKAVVVVNLHEGASAVLVTCFAYVADVHTGCFRMVVFSTVLCIIVVRQSGDCA